VLKLSSDVNEFKPLSVGPSLGSFSLSGEMLFSLLDEFKAGAYTRPISAQRKRFLWDRGCISGMFRGCLGGVRGC